MQRDFHSSLVSKETWKNDIMQIEQKKNIIRAFKITRGSRKDNV